MSDERANDQTGVPHPSDKEPAEGGDVPDAGPGADRVEDAGTGRSG